MKSEFLNCIAVLLLLNLFGCTPEETVTVSGAVSRPGDVAFRPGWGVHNYVAAAGGYLAEADTGRVALVRHTRDSVSVRQRWNVSRWAANDAPAVVSGDMISVPLKAYRVRFDTVLAVRNLQLERKDHIYLMEHGKVALGTTLRGVVAAVIFGNGEAFQGAYRESCRSVSIPLCDDASGQIRHASIGDRAADRPPRGVGGRGGAAPLYVPDVSFQVG